jgi:endonuclease YncB( thermonuclease family)
MKRALKALLLSLAPMHAAAQIDVRSRSTVFSGPYEAEVVRIIDGDTVSVRVAVWPGLVAEYAVRIRGIDAPEIFRPGCAEERIWGENARDVAERLYLRLPEARVARGEPAPAFRLRNVQYDAFSGRVVADLQRWRSDRWISFSRDMLDRNMAVEWQPGQAAVPWCLLAAERGPVPVPEVED